MGWDFTKDATRADIIERQTATWTSEAGSTYTTIARACVGNHLWTVIEKTAPGSEPERFIALFLLRRERNYGWGYKAMSEQSGPFYYTCPMKFLDMVPVANQEWRDGVLAYHAQRKLAYERGDIVQVVDSKVKGMLILGKKGRSFFGIGNDGMLYTLPSNMKGKVLAKYPLSASTADRVDIKKAIYEALGQVS